MGKGKVLLNAVIWSIVALAAFAWACQPTAYHRERDRVQYGNK